MLITIKKLINELNSNEIRYCHWKSNEHLDESYEGDTDLDVLFDYSQKREIEEILIKCGLKRFRSTPLMQYSAIEDFICYDKKSAKIWHLHTHYRMTLGEKHLKGYTVNKWNDYILDNREQNKDGMYICNSEIELALLYIRLALKLRYRDMFKKISNSDIKEINWLKDRVDLDLLKKHTEKMTNLSIASEIIKLNNDLSYQYQLVKLQKLLRKDLKYFTYYSKSSSYFMRTKREIYWLIGGIKRRLGINIYMPKRRISPSGGLAVAIVGCDGAGKSTTISYLVKEFGKKIDVSSFYFGSGDGKSSLLRIPMRLIAKKVGGKGLRQSVDKEYKQSKKVSIKAKIYTLAKIIWAVTLAKEKENKIRKMIKARNNGLLVITDRYPQTMFPGIGDGPLLNKYINKKGIMKKLAEWEKRKYELANINQPDLTIKLIVPTDIAIERKPEMTKSEIDAKKNIILKLELSKKSVIIDTSCDFKDSISKVMDEIWKLI